MTAAEAATLVGQGLTFFGIQSGSEFLARNPHLGLEAYYRPDSDKTDRHGGCPRCDGRVALRHVVPRHSRAPDQWIQRPSLEERGVHAQLGNADPDFATSLSPVSQKSQMAALRNSLGQNAGNTGPAWVLTDYATAVELGLTPVAIENAAGEFVLPTPQSIAAGVATMTVEPDGRRTPDPGASTPGAYPLPMLEYAMAPAEPLVDEACSLRTESQQALSSWLAFLTGPGQEGLGAGFVPLTPELAAEAEQAIARVGTSPSTAACSPTNPGGPTSPGAAGPAAGVGSTAGTGTGGSGAARQRQWHRRRCRCGRRGIEPVDSRRAGGRVRAGRRRRADAAAVPRHRRGERDHLARGPPAGRGAHVGRGVPDLRARRRRRRWRQERAASRLGQTPQCAGSRCPAAADIATSSIATGAARERAAPVRLTKRQPEAAGGRRNPAGARCSGRRPRGGLGRSPGHATKRLRWLRPPLVIARWGVTEQRDR